MAAVNRWCCTPVAGAFRSRNCSSYNDANSLSRGLERRRESMNWLQKLRLRFRALFQKPKLDAQMDDEMRSHIEMQTQENVDAGMSREQARYAALRQFGWVESIKETCRDQRGV